MANGKRLKVLESVKCLWLMTNDKGLKVLDFANDLIYCLNILIICKWQKANGEGLKVLEYANDLICCLNILIICIIEMK